jgi:predicted ArsR family transcriptional regulator
VRNPPNQAGRRIIKINAITQAQLIKLLLDGDRTCAELAEETGLHYVTVLQYTRELHRAGAAHITRYDKDVRGRDMLKVYKIGKGKDARREKKSACERQTTYRSRKRMANLLCLTSSGARA